MKRYIFLFAFLFAVSLVSATCNLEVTLVNQDPYPAMPGDYVKVIFQVTGIQSPDCGTARLWVQENFPFSLDPVSERETMMKSGTYIRNYQSYFLVPYKLRVSEDALEGDNDLTVYYSYLSGEQELIFTKDFPINIEDSRSDFEIHIKDYDPIGKQATFEILNIGESDVQAVTVEIPKQENVHLRGSDRLILGDIDSNEEDSFIFDAELKEGEINLTVTYTDQIAKRRTLKKTVVFDPSFFSYKLENNGSVSPTLMFIIGFLIPVLFVWARIKLRKRKEKRKKEMARK